MLKKLIWWFLIFVTPTFKVEFNPLSDPPSIYSTKKDKNILFLDFLT